VISAGGNDLATLIPNPSCVQNPVPDDCPLDRTLFEISRTLSYVIEDLRAMYEEPRIVLVAYPNFFSGTGHEFEGPASRVLPRLANVLGGVANSYPNWDIVDATPSFDGRGSELTHLMDEPADPHPNDAGHAVIAESVIEASQN
jgi:lysophospholipase L1-like esterase